VTYSRASSCEQKRKKKFTGTEIPRYIDSPKILKSGIGFARSLYRFAQCSAAALSETISLFTGEAPWQGSKRRIGMKIFTLRRGLIAGLGLAALVVGASVYAATTVILAVGTIPESEFFGGPATVTVRTLTIQPGEALAWHYHPGYAFNVVKSGVLTVEDGCGGQEENLLPGQAFEEVGGHVHRAKNLGSEPVVVYNTFIIPQGNGTTNNIPNNERRCGPPSNTDECRFEGWRNFTHPEVFANQGACINWVTHRPEVTVPVPIFPPPSPAVPLLPFE
jgi:quercetin dioxygenase-like cupin family protein